jgi:hypothetical protein
MEIRNTILVAILSALVCFGLCPIVQALEPATPDPGPLAVSNTADGQGALSGATTGLYNSAFGFLALLSNADANFNAGVGAGALLTNTGSENTAVGAGALFSNTTGSPNTAVGAFALWFNTDGSDNNAVGDRALFNNVSADFNNAFGREALTSNVDGDQNNAMGDLALEDNTSGSFNTALGDDALASLVDGSSNTALGDEAGNGCVGCSQGIYIGAGVGPVADSELRFIRIGDTSFTDYDFFAAGIFGRGVDAGTALFVFVDENGKLGTNAIDANGNKVATPQAMINESLKQQRRIAELEGTVERLTALVKEQGAQIQKVSAQLELHKAAPRTVSNR